LSPSDIFGNLSQGHIEPDTAVPPRKRPATTPSSTRKIPKKQRKAVVEKVKARKGKAKPKKTEKDPKEILARGEPLSAKDSSPEPEGI
jgi:hypothetical protein